jgi:predicted nucleotidyltransferase
MGRLSREDDILGLFFNYPTKHWHFGEIKKNVNISDSKIAKWLHKFEKEKLIRKIKEKGSMPYYVGNDSSIEYHDRKMAFGINTLYDSGLISKLLSLKNAPTICIFGSMIDGDWYNESDVDIFIYGDTENSVKSGYLPEIGRKLHIFSAKTQKDFEKFGERLIKNMISGYLIKGRLDFLEVKISCKKTTHR